MLKNHFELHHPGGLTISPSLTHVDLLDSFEDIPRRDMGTGWVWYSLPTFQDGDVVIGISLGFNHDKLESLTLTDAHPEYGASWSDWSEKQERFRAERIGSWLSNKGYPIDSYPWGIVEAGFNTKSGFGSATVRFSP